MSKKIDLGTFQRNDSQDIFEEYLLEIEKLKESAPVSLRGLNFLENTILAIERTLQDFNAKYINQPKVLNFVNISITSLLKNWLDLFLLLRMHDITVELAYNLCQAISLIHNLSQEADYEKYILSLYPPRNSRNYTIAGERMNYINFETGINWDVTVIEFENQLINRLKNNFAKNIFNVPSYERLEFSGVEDLVSLLKGSKDILPFENYILGDDSVTEFEWDFEFIFTERNEKYRAHELSYFIWAFSKAIESIDGIEVFISSWENGSKKIKLRAIISNSFSKVDLKSILDNCFKLAESVYLKKPIEELKNIDAQTKKINAETSLITKQTQNLPDNEILKIQQLIELKKQLLDLEEKEIGLEERRNKAAEHKLQQIDKASSVMLNGMIQNNSDFIIFINGMPGLSIQKGEISRGKSLDVIEVDETKKTESDDKASI